MNLLNLIIFLKDGTQHEIPIVKLKECGTIENIFFIENKKEGRIEIPLDNVKGFKIYRKFVMEAAYEEDRPVLYAAVGILSKHLT